MCIRLFIIKSDLGHKDVLLYAMNKIKDKNNNITIDKDKMKYNEISSKDFFKLPINYEKERYNLGDEYKRPY